MAELKPDMEDNIKYSFSREREHVKLLEKEVKANREFLIKQNEQISFILSKISQISEENDKISRILASFDTKSSIGNKGVGGSPPYFLLYFYIILTFLSIIYI